MHFSVARLTTFVVILFISLRIFAGSVIALPLSSEQALTVQSKKARSSSIFDSFVLEKTEEEIEKTEGDDSGIGRVVLFDFTRLASFLRFGYLPTLQPAEFSFLYDVRPLVHQLNCVFLI